MRGCQPIAEKAPQPCQSGLVLSTACRVGETVFILPISRADSRLFDLETLMRALSGTFLTAGDIADY